MLYHQNIAGCFHKGGLHPDDLMPYQEAAQAHAQDLKNLIDQGAIPALGIARLESDLESLRQIAGAFLEKFQRIFVLGTGGSSLGGQTLAALRGDGLSFRAGQQRVHFLDNIDPFTFGCLEAQLDLQTTGFVVISKSGTTSETLCQMLALLAHYKKQMPAEQVAAHFLLITQPQESPLSAIAAQEGLTVLPHHPGIGGRFSVLSNVGLLPALMADVDVRTVRQGACAVLDRLGTPGCAAVEGAALAAALTQQGKLIHVMMPYSDRLSYFGLWFRQIWAESLGKEGHGATPVRAMGTVDQHSQLQLYLDGPRDKYLTVITTDCLGAGHIMHPGLDYMENRRMGDLMDAHQRATIATLIKQGRPTRVLHVPQIDERALGALLMHYMLETILTSRLMGVDPFNQPAVEEGKILARRYLES